MPDYEFFSRPKLISGTCALESIPSELKNNGACKPLIVSGSSLGQRSMKKKLIKAFYDSDCSIGAFYDQIDIREDYQRIQDAAFLFKERKCDSIVVAGGGRVVNAARAVNCIVSENRGSLFYEGMRVSKRLKPFIVVPACCTNGTEAGNILLINGCRIESDFLIPDVIVLDKRMTRMCSLLCAARSSAVALDNALNAFMDESANSLRDAFVHAALSAVSHHMADLLKEPENKNHGFWTANAGVIATTAALNAKQGLAAALSEILETYTSIDRSIFVCLLAQTALELRCRKQGLPRNELLLYLSGIENYVATPEEQRSEKGINLAMNFFISAAAAVACSSSSIGDPFHAISPEVAEKACKKAAAAGGRNFTEKDCFAVLDKARQNTVFPRIRRTHQSMWSKK